MDNSLKRFSGRLDCISLLRIVGATGVALYHMGFLNGVLKSLQGGVYLFFTISGFLIMYTTQNSDSRKFLIKRLIRILSLYWIMTILTFVVMKLLPAFSLGNAGFAELLKSMLFIPYARAGLKSAVVVRPIVGPGWTLYYDVFFMLFFAIAMRISHKYRGAIASGVCLGLSLSSVIVTEHPFFQIVCTKWWISFAGGILAYYVLKTLWNKELSCNIRTLALIFFAGGMILLFIIPINQISHAFISFLAFIGCVLFFKNQGMPPIVNHLGNISFSFYLLHYYVIVIIGKFIDLTGGATAVLGAILVMLITIALASISNYVVEQKFANKLKKVLHV